MLQGPFSPKDPISQKGLDETELEQECAPKPRGLRTRFLPVSLRDLRVYGRLLGYVRPYRVKLVLIVLLSILAAGLSVSQYQILEVGLSGIFPGPGPPPVSQAPVPRGEAENGAAPLGSAAESPEGSPEDSGGLRNRAKETLRELFGGTSERALTPSERREKLLLVALLLILAVALEQGLTYIQSVRMVGVMRHVVTDMRLHLFGHLLAQPVRFYQTNPSAKLMARVTLELNRFGSLLTSILIDWFREIFTIAFLTIGIVLKDASFVFLIALVLLITYLPIQQVGRRLRYRDKASQRGMAEVFAVLQEALASSKVVKAFGSEEREMERFRTSNRAYNKMMMKLSRLQSLTQPLVGLVGALGLGALLWFGGGRVIDGRTKPETFIIIVMLLFRILTSMRKVGKMSNSFQLGLAAADRLNALLDTPPETPDSPGAKELTGFQRKIAWRNVRFAYEPGRPVLKGIKLEVRKGQTLALVGPSGAGKSTLVDLLPRFYEVKGGSIRIDGTDIREFTLKSLRSQIAIVTQETILFRHTVRENIAYGRPTATFKEIREAARAAHAHDFIMALTEGYDTMLGERAVRLSGGERQRIAIARALLKNAPILILDEPTSALDSESEALVQAALSRLTRGRTVIIIAHRLATVQRADLIAVIRGGVVAEKGTHEELLQGNGLYARLHALQTSTGKWEALAEHLGLAPVQG
ncbi:MAG: ABC transporter ATP-binding protein [Planctomycetota bacterium]